MSNFDIKREYWCAKILTADNVKTAILRGYDTARQIAGVYNVTACTAAQDLKALYDAGVLNRTKRGPAFVYTINEE